MVPDELHAGVVIDKVSRLAAKNRDMGYCYRALLMYRSGPVPLNQIRIVAAPRIGSTRFIYRLSVEYYVDIMSGCALVTIVAIYRRCHLV
jgi:hypothetical protein